MYLRLWLGAAGIVLLVASPAMPFCLAPQPRVTCAEYFQSDLVVTATLVKSMPIPEGEDESAAARVYTLEVNQSFRGKASATLQVFEENSSGRAPFEWIPGQRYLLFLNIYDNNLDLNDFFPLNNYKPTDRTFWDLDGCGNSAPIEKAAAALSAIKTIQKAPTSSTIEGVVGGMGRQPLFSGVHVEAQGQGGRFAAVTDDKGRFEMRVPPGRYRVNVVEPGHLFDSGELSYSDIDNPLEPGGCAQIQFDELPAPPSP